MGTFWAPIKPRSAIHAALGRPAPEPPGVLREAAAVMCTVWAEGSPKTANLSPAVRATGRPGITEAPGRPASTPVRPTSRPTARTPRT